jgi:DNA helicase II / ATP-dependent DNA helicase PcrA
MPKIDDILKEHLDARQQKAAGDPNSEILTLACAGSGKSRTLAFRIAWLIAQGIDPSNIVAFTFTEKAAESIKARTAFALSKASLNVNALGQMYIGTIHSYCNLLLTKMDAVYRQFDVLDENRLKLYLLYYFYDDYLGIRHLMAVKNSRQFETLAELTSAWMIANDEILPDAPLVAADPTLGEVLSNLNAKLERDQFVDFSLMQRRVVDALRRDDPGIKNAIPAALQVLVDEYQDINPVQEELIARLHCLGGTLFVVGDDDQAIYSWRGADVTRILTFQERYPHSTKHVLNKNYRSCPAIVETADAFAAGELGASRLPKDPKAEDRPGPRDFRVLWFDTRQKEAAWVAQRIQELLETRYEDGDGKVRGLTPADFAILMRSTREPEQDSHPRHAAFTQALTSLGIPYSLEAGGGLFDRPEVSALRDSFELLRNGQPNRSAAQTHFDAIVRPCFPDASFPRFAQVLTKWGRDIHGPIGDGGRRRIYPQQLVHDLLEAFGVQVTQFDDGTLQDLGVFSQILQDVEAVFMSVDSTGRFQTILNFLQNVAQRGYDAGETELLAKPDAVTVSTVHRMKGLEFPAVFVVDVEAQRFPKNMRAYSGWIPPKIIQSALQRGAYQSSRDEEARLFYTAMTRAERFLCISGSERLPNGKQTRKRSPFMLRLSHPEIRSDPDELPEGLQHHQRVRRIESSDLPTSYSDLKYYLRCPRDYKFRKVYGFSPAIADLFGFGRAVHAAVGKLHEKFQLQAPSIEDASAIAKKMFHLKHVPKSGNPETNPGPYERARERASVLVADYASDYSSDFERRRQVEARFEIPIGQAVISGSIDLMFHEDPEGKIIEAEVVDFKTLGQESGKSHGDLEWSELALQVQLYATAARDVLLQATQRGHVHLLKDNDRVEIPITGSAIDAALANIHWAVEGIINEDFAMRPSPKKCEGCDFRQLCPKRPQEFSHGPPPPPIEIWGGEKRMAAAFAEFAPE